MEEKRFNVLDYGVKKDIDAVQTHLFQKALDACAAAGGGTVIVPAGAYVITGIRLYDRTTLLLQDGSRLLGGLSCEDYPLPVVPYGMPLHTDMQMIGDYYLLNFGRAPWDTYRRAMICAYGAKDIAVLGEGDAVIDGRDCYDPHGEEGFRGPHGIFFTNCRNVRLENYTIMNNGNFMHQIDTTTDLLLKNVTCLAGHDATHLHGCENVEIAGCTFHTGDDCIAGINMKNVHIADCDVNTSCQDFRMGGSHILVERCRFWGPGIYPHRMTVVKDRDHILPREAGRHNTISFMTYFSSETFPMPEATDITFRDCTIEGVDRFLHYEANSRYAIHAGTPLTGLTLENVTFTGLAEPSCISGDPGHPLELKLKNVSFSYREGAQDRGLLGEIGPGVTVTEE